MLRLGFLSILSISALPHNALAWGDIAHERIQESAIRLLVEQNHPLAQFFQQNSATLARVATTPDRDWTSKGWPGTSKKAARRGQVFREQGLHYFEVDAFLRGGVDEASVLSLPQGEYAAVKERYGKLLRENVAHVLEYGRNQSDPSAYGTAPWRALQAFDLAVAALRAHDAAKMLLYLGVLSHYVGDLAEPLNTTLNFDGKHYPIPASGVHVALEEKVFEQEPLSTAHVLEAARDSLSGRGLDGLTRDRVLGELFRIVASGQAHVDPLLKTFSELCGKSHGRALASVARDEASAKKAKRAKQARDPYEGALCDPTLAGPEARRLTQAFARSVVERTDDGEHDVMDVATDRLGAAAALSARLWAAAYNEAGRPAVSAIVVPFEALKAREGYFLPTYLPQ